MDEFKFNCPDYLAQRFWKLCVSRKDTPGAVLRAYMVREVRKIDPDYAVDLASVRASAGWNVRDTSGDNGTG